MELIVMKRPSAWVFPSILSLRSHIFIRIFFSVFKNFAPSCKCLLSGGWHRDRVYAISIKVVFNFSRRPNQPSKIMLNLNFVSNLWDCGADDLWIPDTPYWAFSGVAGRSTHLKCGQKWVQQDLKRQNPEMVFDKIRISRTFILVENWPTKAEVSLMKRWNGKKTFLWGGGEGGWK